MSCDDIVAQGCTPMQVGPGLPSRLCNGTRGLPGALLASLWHCVDATLTRPHHNPVLTHHQTKMVADALASQGVQLPPLPAPRRPTATPPSRPARRHPRRTAMPHRPPPTATPPRRPLPLATLCPHPLPLATWCPRPPPRATCPPPPTARSWRSSSNRWRGERGEGEWGRHRRTCSALGRVTAMRCYASPASPSSFCPQTAAHPRST